MEVCFLLLLCIVLLTFQVEVYFLLLLLCEVLLTFQVEVCFLLPLRPYSIQFQHSTDSDTLSACWVTLVFPHWISRTLDMDYGIFNVRRWSFCFSKVYSFIRRIVVESFCIRIHTFASIQRIVVEDFCCRCCFACVFTRLRLIRRTAVESFCIRIHTFFASVHTVRFIVSSKWLL